VDDLFIADRLATVISCPAVLFGSHIVHRPQLTSGAERDPPRVDDARLRDWDGAGTQALVLMAGEMISGKPNELSRALLMALAWLINLAVAEWVIRRRPAPRARVASIVVSHQQ
jgi:hypothetical protein